MMMLGQRGGNDAVEARNTVSYRYCLPTGIYKQVMVQHQARVTTTLSGNAGVAPATRKINYAQGRVHVCSLLLGCWGRKLASGGGALHPTVNR